MPTAPRPPPNQHRNAQIRHCEYPYPPITRIFRVVQAIPPSHAKFLIGQDFTLTALGNSRILSGTEGYYTCIEDLQNLV